MAFRLEPGDDALVVAESLGTLATLRPNRAMAPDGAGHIHEHGHDHAHEPA